MRVGAAWAAAAWLLVAPIVPAAAGAPPSLKELLARVGAYVQSYGEKASIVVASERYSQQASSNEAAGNGARTTIAEFAIVKTPGENINRWVGFRDVVEVDGKPVTDHSDRLIALLTSGSGADEARRLSEESSRFNIGRIRRNFNVPTTALLLFLPENLRRFKLSLKGTAPDGVTQIAFRETSRPTFIHSLQGVPVPVEGSIWAAADGTVTRTEMHTNFVDNTASVMADVDVTYELISAVPMWLPAAMTESYQVRRAALHARIDCHAEYSNYRTFQTSVRIKR